MAVVNLSLLADEAASEQEKIMEKLKSLSHSLFGDMGCEGVFLVIPMSDFREAKSINRRILVLC